MKNRISLMIIGVLIIISATVSVMFPGEISQAIAETANITQSFETINPPDNWVASSGNLSVSDKRFKLGEKSLLWNIGSGDSIKVANELNMTESAIGRNIKSSGFIMWVYSEKNHDNQKITFQLGDQKQLDAGEKLSFSFDFHMDFVGWRTLWVRLSEDSAYTSENFKKHNNGSLELNTMKIIASEGLASNNIYFDALIFEKNIFWNRASDYQLKSEKRIDDGLEAITNWSGAYLYSQRNPIIPLRTITADDISNFSAIESKLDEWIFGTNRYGEFANPRPSSLKSQVNNAKKKYNSLNIKLENGVWTGKPLFCAESPFISQGERFTRATAETIFLPFALDYKINGNQESLGLLMNLFDYWNDQGWAYGSGIGSLDHETLRASGYFAAVYIVREQLEQTSRLKREEKTLQWYSEFGKVYPNSSEIYEQTTADEMRTHFLNRLFSVMIMQDSPQKVQAMESYLAWINGALKINPNRGDTIKPDFTGFHHNNVYMNAYPPHGYHMASMVNYMLSGTKFEMDKDARYNLKQALITHDIMTNTATVPFQVRGRFPVQNSDIGQEILPSYAYMALAGDPVTGNDFDLEMAQIFMKKWEGIGASGQKVIKGYNIGGISFINSYGALDVVFEILKREITPSTNHEGFWSMPYSGMAINRQNDWMVAVKGFSKYMWDFESGPSENMYGRYSSYGMINVLSAGVERDGINYINDISNGYDYNNGWDWNRFAGTTAINLPLERLHANSGTHRNYSDTTFLGATGLGSQGIWGMDLQDKTFNKSFKAKKSVVMLDGEIIVLGSDISNNDGANSTETTIFQNAIFNEKLPIVVSGNTVNDFPYTYQGNSESSCWLIDPYNNGYYLPSSAGLNISRKAQNSFKADGKTASSGNYATAWIDHGKQPESAGYEYAMLVNTNKDKMAAYSQNKQYSVLKKDNTAHVVSKKSSGIMAYSIFDAGAKLPASGIIQSTDTPILAFCKSSNNKTTLSISDPDLRIGSENEPTMQNSVMKKTRVTLVGKQKLLNGSDNIRIIERNSNSTVIEVDCIDGKSYEIEVEAEKPRRNLVLTGESDGLQFTVGDEVTIECPLLENKVFTHWTVTGLTLNNDELKHTKLTFIMPDNDVQLTANYRLTDAITTASPQDKSQIILVCVYVGIGIILVIGTILGIIIIRKKRKKPKI